MKNITQLFTLLLIASLFTACEKEIKLNLPPYSSKIVINGELNTNNAMGVEISKSIAILTETDSTGYLLMDAKASIFEDGVKLGNMTYGQLLYNYNKKPLPGKTYRIEVSRSGMPDAYVEVLIPDNVVVTSLFKDSVSVDNFGFPVGQLTVSFKDVAATNNYYQFSVRTYADKQNTWYPLNIESNDPVFLNNTKLDDGSYIFSDATFNGQTKSIALSIPFGTVSSTPGIDKFEISIKTFSSEYYNYLQQVRDYKQKTGTFDTDPIIMKTNVMNGLGMVGGVSNFKDTLR